MSIDSKKTSTPYFYSMMGQVLAKVNNNTYLGIAVSDNIQWETQITRITAKAKRTLGFFRRNFHMCPNSERSGVFQPDKTGLIRSKLEYMLHPFGIHM